MSVIEDIISWANSDLLDWQRETVRRLLTQESLTADDQEQLYKLFKKSHDLLITDAELPTPGLLKNEDLLGTPGTKQPIVLKALQGIKNVNAIPDNSEIRFANQGLTVIYGENGAGKSGYARILKKACFARDDKEKVHGNIFRENTTQPAETTFKLGFGKKDIFPKWTDGQQKSEMLANIRVFDSKCARIIIDERNAVSYLPYGADVFQKLAEIVQQFKSRLEKETPKLIKPEISDLPENTKAGAFFKSLNADTKDDDLAQWAQWTEEDEALLNGSNSTYVKAAAGDTTRQIRVLGNLKKRLTSFKEKFSELTFLFSSESLNAINQLIKSRTVFQKAFDVASRTPQGPLDGIATTEWQALYLAAKDYSVKHAYPAEVFPVTGEGKRCVLCMQPLLKDANDRLDEFHKYMENSAKTSLDDTSKKLADKITCVKSMDIAKFQTEDYRDVLDEIENRDKELSQNISKCISTCENVRAALIKAVSSGTVCNEVASDFDCADLEKIPVTLDGEIEKCRINSNPEGLEKLKTQLTELKARKQFALNHKAISTYVNSLKVLSL